MSSLIFPTGSPRVNLLEFSVSKQRNTFSHSLIFPAIKATVEFLIRSDFLKHLTRKNCDKILLKISLRNFKKVTKLTTFRRSRASLSSQKENALRFY